MVSFCRVFRASCALQNPFSAFKPGTIYPSSRVHVYFVLLNASCHVELNSRFSELPRVHFLIYKRLHLWSGIFIMKIISPANLKQPKTNYKYTIHQKIEKLRFQVCARRQRKMAALSIVLSLCKSCCHLLIASCQLTQCIRAALISSCLH